MTQTNLVSRIYHSREDRISDIHSEKEKLQYDGHDIDRLNALVEIIDEYGSDFAFSIEKLVENFNDDEEHAYSRRHLIERWALMQAALSKVAWSLRFDGNIAYERMINALKTGAAADMRGL
jgi:hypothetical protein